MNVQFKDSWHTDQALGTQLIADGKITKDTALKLIDKTYAAGDIITLDNDVADFLLKEKVVGKFPPANVKELTTMTKEEPETKTDIKALADSVRNKRLLEISQRLIDKYNFITIAGKRDDTIYYYTDGIYKPQGDMIIKQEADKELVAQAKNHTVNEIIGHVKRKTYHTRDFFNQVPPELVCVKNGILNLITLELTAHTPKQYFLTQLPIDFKPEAKCPQFKQALSKWLYEEDITTLQEFIGSALYKKNIHKKAAICIGEPDTGKTTALTIIGQMFGDENASSESLMRISTDKFSAASLEGKHLNIFDDLPFQDLAAAGMFKTVTGGGYVAAEVKFGDRWKFINTAKFIYTCNKIPRLKDTDDMAYYGRWVILRFPNQIPEKERDPLLAEKIQLETSGILNWGLEGLKRLLVSFRFTHLKSAEENKMIMIKNNEPVLSFAEDMLLEKQDSFVTKNDMRAAYSDYARKNKLPMLTLTALTQKFQVFASYIQSGQRMVENKKTEVYTSVTLKYSKDYQDFFHHLSKEKGNSNYLKGSVVGFNTRRSNKTPDSTDNYVMKYDEKKFARCENCEEVLCVCDKGGLIET